MIPPIRRPSQRYPRQFDGGSEPCYKNICSVGNSPANLHRLPLVRIAHIAVKVADIQAPSTFLERVFGFTHMGTVVHPTTTFNTRESGGGHTSRHLTDGATDLTLVRYDDDSTAEPGSSAGAGPCIHHFGVEADDLNRYAQRIPQYGGAILSDSGLPTVKFRAPGGTMAEIVPRGWFSPEAIAANAERRRRGLPAASVDPYGDAARHRQDSALPAAGTKPRITHIAIKVEDVEPAAGFYEKVFGFKPFARYYQRDHLSVHLTDGAIDLAIIKFDNHETDAATAAGSGPCIHHIGIDVAQGEMDQYVAKILGHGCEFISDPGAVTVKFRLPGGAGIAEIAPFGWHFRTPES